MTIPGNDYKTPLERTPECAQRIAVTIGLFSTVESLLVETFRWIANMPFDQVRVAIESHRSLSGKLLYLKGVCAAGQPDWERDIEACNAFVSAVDIASRTRNTYAHSTYRWSGEPEAETLYLGAYAAPLGSQEREAVATVPILDQDIAWMRSLIDAMQDYAAARGRGEEPNLEAIKRLLRTSRSPNARSPRAGDGAQ